MFRKYHQKFWHRRVKANNNRDFSMARIDKIDAKIKSREKIEQANFDKAFAAELAKL